jgi:hypothetical protein
MLRSCKLVLLLQWHSCKQGLVQCLSCKLRLLLLLLLLQGWGVPDFKETTRDTHTCSKTTHIASKTVKLIHLCFLFLSNAGLGRA